VSERNSFALLAAAVGATAAPYNYAQLAGSGVSHPSDRVKTDPEGFPPRAVPARRPARPELHHPAWGTPAFDPSATAAAGRTTTRTSEIDLFIRPEGNHAVARQL
jgi:hypothetical protein